MENVDSVDSVATEIKLKPLATKPAAREGYLVVELPFAEYGLLEAFRRSGAWELRKAAEADDIEAGMVSLERALHWATHEGGSGAATFASLLASLYNGNRVQMDASRLIFSLDNRNFEHAMNVLRLCQVTRSEPHTFFENGGALFEQMIKQWGFEKKRSAKS